MEKQPACCSFVFSFSPLFYPLTLLITIPILRVRPLATGLTSEVCQPEEAEMHLMGIVARSLRFFGRLFVFVQLITQVLMQPFCRLM